MFDIGMPELVLIFIVALIVFGPKRLPEIGKSLGKALHELKKSTNEFKQNFESEIGTAQAKEELLKHQRELQASLMQSTTVEPQPVEVKKDDPPAVGAGEAPAAPASDGTPAETAHPEKTQENKSHAG